MIKNILNNKFLFIIILLAGLLRIWNIGNNPPSITPDEASLGYNAYSILKTGRDMHGDFMPIIMKSFGDYTPTLYAYFTIPFIAVFGLTEFTTRIVGILSGVISVYLIYLLARLIFEKINVFSGSKNIALVALFLAAVNPWLIYFSRGAWVPNLSLTLTLAGIYYFFKSLEKNKFLYLSVISFALTLLSYQGAKITTSLVVLLLILFFGKKLVVIPKSIIIRSVMLGVLISFPIILSMFQGKASRLDVISLFSYPRTKEYVQNVLNQGGEKFASSSYYLFHSESLNFGRALLGRYFNHFSARFLVFEGDWENPRHNPPYSGMILFADLLLILPGLIVFASKIKQNQRYVWFILSWLLLAPIPAALTRDQIHAVRSFHMVIPIILIASAGLSYIYFYLVKKGLIGKSIIGILILFYGLNLFYYLDSIFIHMPYYNAKYWNYGYKEVVQKTLAIKDNYQRIVVRQSYEQPFIYFLFYGVSANVSISNPKIASELISFSESEVGDVGLITRLDNIYFLPISWPIGGVSKGDLVVIDGAIFTDEMIGNDFKVISEIKYPDDFYTAFWIMEKI